MLLLAKTNVDRTTSRQALLSEGLVKVHIHWASHARDPWSHARLHSFPGNQKCGLHKHIYTVFFHHIVIVFVRNYHNMVNKYCIHIYTTLLVTWETVKLCMRCSVYVHHYVTLVSNEQSRHLVERRKFCRNWWRESVISFGIFNFLTWLLGVFLTSLSLN